MLSHIFFKIYIPLKITNLSGNKVILNYPTQLKLTQFLIIRILMIVRNIFCLGKNDFVSLFCENFCEIDDQQSQNLFE